MFERVRARKTEKGVAVFMRAYGTLLCAASERPRSPVPGPCGEQVSKSARARSATLVCNASDMGSTTTCRSTPGPPLAAVNREASRSRLPQHFRQRHFRQTHMNTTRTDKKVTVAPAMASMYDDIGIGNQLYFCFFSFFFCVSWGLKMGTKD
jgi:hypothetical protein